MGNRQAGSRSRGERIFHAVCIVLLTPLILLLGIVLALFFPAIGRMSRKTPTPEPEKPEDRALREGTEVLDTWSKSQQNG